jgi:hypothetical protein
MVRSVREFQEKNQIETKIGNWRVQNYGSEKAPRSGRGDRFENSDFLERHMIYVK